MMHPALLRTPAAPAFAVARPPAAAARRPGRAAPERAKRLLHLLSAWTDGGYRPERHYMRGGRTEGAKSLAAAG